MNKIIAGDAYEIFMQAILSRHKDGRSTGTGDPSSEYVEFSDADIKALVNAVWADRNENEEARTKTFENEVRRIMQQNRDRRE